MWSIALRPQRETVWGKLFACAHFTCLSVEFLADLIVMHFLTRIQRVFYFPVKDRLLALLKTSNYRHLIEHEFDRPSDPQNNLMSDIFDTPAWKKLMGPPSTPNRRIAFQICGDSIPAFSANTLSIKPIEWFCWSLPPTLRYLVDYMQLLMLIPAKFKGPQQRKYWDFAADFEITDLFHNGVDEVKIRIFGTSLDTPGRAEMLGVCVFFACFILSVL